MTIGHSLSFAVRFLDHFTRRIHEIGEANAGLSDGIAHKEPVFKDGLTNHDQAAIPTG